MKICIIGAGWYGCHIAKVLTSLDVEVSLFEKENKIFAGASGFNQNRLHLGFHYPRNHRTRLQSLLGFDRFKEEYPDLISEISNNIYAVPSLKSLMDYKTYCGIMASTGIPYFSYETPSFLNNIEGSINTNEMLISVSKAIIYFENILQECLKLNHEVKNIKSNVDHVLVDGVKYDYLIDCTWGHLKPNDETFFEASLLLKMKKINDFDTAITLVDGDLWSLYPTENSDIYTLSSVLYTPLTTKESSKEIKKEIGKLTDEYLTKVKIQIIEHAQQFFPNILDYFEFSDYQISIKTKLKGFSSDRSCYVNKTERIISIQSGKIDNIFYASNYIMKIISNEN